MGLQFGHERSFVLNMTFDISPPGSFNDCQSSGHISVEFFFTRFDLQYSLGKYAF